MRRRVLGLTVSFLLLSALGCTSGGTDSAFARKVEQVQPGTPKAAVQRQLGRPDEKRMAVVGSAPKEVAPTAAAAGSRYEKWTYVRGEKRYDVLMAPSQERRGQWEVRDVKTSTATASAW